MSHENNSFAPPEEDYSERIRNAQLQARYEQRLKSKDQELRHLQERLNRKEDEAARMQAEFERDRQGLLYNLNQLSHVVATERKGQSQRGPAWSKKKDKDPVPTDRNSEGPRHERGNGYRAEGIVAATSRFRPSKEARDTPGADRRVERPAVVWRPPTSGTLWSADRFEKYVRQTPGAFEVKAEADGSQWTLRMRFEDLTPPLNDEGMQVFCRWLHHSMQRIREGKGIRSMRMVEAEVSFSWNYMGDEAVGRLLQALQRSELRVSSLNFSGNCLGTAGALHVLDFIQEASFSFGIREVALSHNLLDEVAVMDLLTAFADHPKYPLRRHGKADPVTLFLSNNGLHTSKLLKKMGASGVLSLQSCRTRSGREWLVLKSGMALLKLPDFEMQEQIQDLSEGELDRADRAKAERSKLLGRAKTGATRPEIFRPATSQGGPGVPEQTPEPDAQMTGLKQITDENDLKESLRKERKMSAPVLRQSKPSKRLDKANRQYRDRLRNVAAGAHRIEEHPNEDDEEDEPDLVTEKTGGEVDPEAESLSPVARPAVRITAPPKILQRGSAVMSIAVQAQDGLLPVSDSVAPSNP